MKKILLSLLVLSAIICNFTIAQNTVVIKSEGSTLTGDNQVAHSGTLFNIDSKNISLKYLEKNSQSDSIH